MIVYFVGDFTMSVQYQVTKQRENLTLVGFFVGSGDGL